MGIRFGPLLWCLAALQGAMPQTAGQLRSWLEPKRAFQRNQQSRYYRMDLDAGIYDFSLDCRRAFVKDIADGSWQLQSHAAR